MKIIAIVLVIFFSWVFFDFDYNADDARISTLDRSHVSSLERMMKWSPISGRTLFPDFEIASDDASGSNLDGLNVDQIHEIANQRRVEIYKQEIESISSAMEEMKSTGHTPHFCANFKRCEIGRIGKDYSLDSLEANQMMVRAELARTEDEMSSFFNFNFRSFPKSMVDVLVIISFWYSLFQTMLH